MSLLRNYRMQQKKQEKNEKRQAKGNQSKKLPTKYH